jgi:6,7-dimethyl-8-ribityllumazine synthase
METIDTYPATPEPESAPTVSIDMEETEIDYIPADHDGAGLRIGIVRSRGKDALTKTIQAACLTELINIGVDRSDIICASVPGALDLAFALSQMAVSDQFDALIGIGCIVRGETYQFEVTSNESARGLADVGLRHGIPVANAVLIVDTGEQAQARAESKGAEAARIAVELTNLTLALAELDEDLDDDDPLAEVLR